MNRPSPINQLFANLAARRPSVPAAPMSESKQRISEMMDRFGHEGRDIPVPLMWAWYHRQLKTLSLTATDRPPGPLILGGSTASDEEKLERLEEQLRWASRRDGLDEALKWLDDIEYGRLSSRLNKVAKSTE